MAAIAPEKLLERLARGRSVAAVLLTGTDPYLRDLCRKSIIEACVPEGAREWAVWRMAPAAGDWPDILQRAQTLPMLAPRQVIIVEDVESVESLGEKSREEIVEALEAYFESPAPFTVLVLEAAKLDNRQRFAKLLAEKALTVELTIGSESAASLAAQMAKDLGVQIERDAAAMLADILNGEPARIRMEMEKLAAYVQGRGLVTMPDVEALVVAARKNTVWQLADMLAARKRKEALEFLENLLREGEQPIGIVGVLGWMYRKLIEARELPAHTRGWEAASRLQMRGESVEAALRNARRFGKKELLAALVALGEADSALKTSNPDPRATLEYLIAQLTAGAPA
jgi:DNA polymerase III subunit delta